MVASPAPPGLTPSQVAEIETPDAPWDAEPEVRESVVGAAWHGQRLDKVVVAVAGEFSRTHLQTLIEHGHVRLDGAVASSASRRVLAGQVMRLELVPTAESRAFRPEALAFTIVHEDDSIVVVDKAAGMVVHPAAGNWSGTLLNALLAHHPAAARLPRAGIVHRLDKDTSGLMVVGKTLAAVTSLVRAIAAREVHRRYLAIAHGELQSASICIDAPVGRDPKSRIRMAVVGGGRPARTDVVRLACREGYSALRCTLQTGRTHQIRVHLASLGHPLVGDSVYGGKPALGMSRQALHAVQLGFRHPSTGLDLLFDAPAPGDFEAAWRRVGSDSKPGADGLQNV